MEDTLKTILIVEDEKPLSEILTERFENEGFRVIRASDGKEALELALKKNPDLILLDVMMPHMGGLSMLKVLRTHEEGKNIPVMILTNLNDTETINEALAGGAYDILIKSDLEVRDIVENVRHRLFPENR
jgi:DNA-binding response OmpR family regulator